MTGTKPHTWRADLMDDITFVGLDVHKATVCVSVAESGRGGEVRQIGVFENRPEALSRLVTRLGKSGRRLSFCYEAGPLWLRSAAPADWGRARVRGGCAIVD